jgi:hypothetical protein
LSLAAPVFSLSKPIIARLQDRTPFPTPEGQLKPCASFSSSIIGAQVQSEAQALNMAASAASQIAKLVVLQYFLGVQRAVIFVLDGVGVNMRRTSRIEAGTTV